MGPQVDGLADKGGQGRKPSLPEAKVARVITEATRPPKGRSRWSVRGVLQEPVRPLAA